MFLKFILKGPVDYDTTLVQILDWCLISHYLNQWCPSLLTHIYITRSQLFNSLRPSDAYMHGQSNHHWFRLWLGAWSAIIWTNAGILLNGHLHTNFSEILIEIITFLFHENAFESVVYEMAAILPRPQCVNLPAVLPPVPVYVQITAVTVRIWG